MVIENNTDWNFNDLEEMQWSVKTLKRNNKKFKETLIGPSMAAGFPRVLEIPSSCFSHLLRLHGVGFGPKFLRHGWRADT